MFTSGSLRMTSDEKYFVSWILKEHSWESKGKDWKSKSQETVTLRFSEYCNILGWLIQNVSSVLRPNEGCYGVVQKLRW